MSEELVKPLLGFALSVRTRMTAVLLLLAVVAAAQAGMTMYWIDAAAFMLKRAETSRKQLDLYEQLSSDVAQYMLGLDNVPFSADKAEATRRVETIAKHVEQLTSSIQQEVDFGALHGDEVDNTEEAARLQGIGSVISQLVHAEGGVTQQERNRAASLYQGQLKPMLDDAMNGERDEVADVMRQMEILRDRLLWIGGICLGLPLLMAAALAGIIGQAVLRPVSKLVKGVKLLGQGQLSHRIQVLRHDEFGLLAQHINHMARQLENRNQKLLEHNERLEVIVNQRTLSLREMNDELRQVDESRRRFFADVSHELRTPLTIITGEADVALTLGGGDPQSYRDALSVIRANAGYLRRRIDDLLSIARAVDGRPSFARSDVDLGVVIGETISLCDGLAKANGVTLRREGKLDAVIIDGDLSWLRQCLLTLVDNAIKFSRPGQVVRLILAQDETRTAVSIADEGEGISPEELPNLFERFYQTRSGQRMGGTGLGLSIARWIVEAHGGTIQASSIQGTGMTITMLFPDMREDVANEVVVG